MAASVPPGDDLVEAVQGVLFSRHLWEGDESFALVRLCHAYLRRGGDALLAPAPDSALPRCLQGSTPVMRLLGLFQSLVQTRTRDHMGFLIAEAVVEHLPLEHFAEYLPTVWTIILRRLSNPRMRTDKFVRCFMLFLCSFIGKHGATVFAQQINALQPEEQGGPLYYQVLTSVFVPHASSIQGRVERKMTAIGLAKILFETDGLIDDEEETYTRTALILSLCGLLEESGEDTHGCAAGRVDQIVGCDDEDGEDDFYAFGSADCPDPFATTNPQHLTATLVHAASSRASEGTVHRIISEAVGQEGLDILSERAPDP